MKFSLKSKYHCANFLSLWITAMLEESMSSFALSCHYKLFQPVGGKFIRK